MTVPHAPRYIVRNDRGGYRVWDRDQARWASPRLPTHTAAAAVIAAKTAYRRGAGRPR